MESMVWLDVLSQLLLVLPLAISAFDSTYYVLKLLLSAVGMSKGRQRGDRENCIEALLESLDLDLYSLVEGVVENQVHVVLSILEGHIKILASVDQLDMIIAW